MPKTFGKIPQSKKIRVLETIYYDFFKTLSAEMLSLEPGSYTETAGVILMRKAKDMIGELNWKAVKWANSVIPMVYKDAQAITLNRLRSIRAKKDIRFDDNLHRKAKEAEVDVVINDLFEANASIERQVSMYIYLLGKAARGMSQLQAFGDLRDEKVISNLLDDAIREGQSRGKLAQLIRLHFKRDLYERKWINISGRNYDLIKYAKMVARTRLRIIQSEATKNMCQEYDSDLIEISDHGTECEICQEYEGNIYSISGRTPGYDVISEWPPYHPNCMHSAAPTSETAIRWRETH